MGGCGWVRDWQHFGRRGSSVSRSEGATSDAFRFGPIRILSSIHFRLILVYEQ